MLLIFAEVDFFAASTCWPFVLEICHQKFYPITVHMMLVGWTILNIWIILESSLPKEKNVKLQVFIKVFLP